MQTHFTLFLISIKTGIFSTAIKTYNKVKVDKIVSCNIEYYKKGKLLFLALTACNNSESNSKLSLLKPSGGKGNNIADIHT